MTVAAGTADGAIADEGADSRVHLHYVDLLLVFAVDLPALLPGDGRSKGWSSFNAVRAEWPTSRNRESFAKLRSSDAVSEDEAEIIRTRAADASGRRGKSIWTDSFTTIEAPLRLKVTPEYKRNGHAITADNRLSDMKSDPLHRAKFTEHSLKLYREGTVTYTVRFKVMPPRSSGAGAPGPLSAENCIASITKLESDATQAFRRELFGWLASSSATRLLKELGLPHQYVQESQWDERRLRQRTQLHNLILVDTFLTPSDKQTLDDDYPGWAALPPDQAMRDVSFAGLLNTAPWFKKYRPEYLEALISKDLGYRDDEIYLTDRKSTLICNSGFWDPEDSLSLYREDVLLLVEYWIARLSQAQSILHYLQSDEQARSLTTIERSKALQVIDQARAILARLQEATTPTRVLNHGFSERFATRVAVEVGMPDLLGFIHRLITDMASGLDLRSTVTAQEITSRAALRVNWGTLAVSAAALVASITALVLTLTQQ